jgi:hypothetical protein
MLYHDQLNVIAQHLKNAYPKPSEKVETESHHNTDTSSLPHVCQMNIDQKNQHRDHNTTQDTPIVQSNLGKLFTLKELNSRNSLTGNNGGWHTTKCLTVIVTKACLATLWKPQGMQMYIICYGDTPLRCATNGNQEWFVMDHRAKEL